MPANIGACPSLDILERLLAEKLTGAERDAVEAHVEKCQPCQGQLERFVAATLREAVRPAELGPEPAEGFLSKLRELPPPQPGDSLRIRAQVPPADADMGNVRDAAGAIPAWLQGGRLGQYEILGKLGQGGMGAVFKARHTELGKIVALKVLPVQQMDEVTVGRFKNEVRAIGKLDHPNIVVAHDAGESRGVHFLVMEFVDGMDLARLAERHVRLPVADACEAIRQAAAGLQHAYERGLVHRDIKPPNLMLARDGRVRLLDMGLARSFGEAHAHTLTAHGSLLGTADYLAPEQWDHPHAADTRADIYSLGCTLYHLLAGHPPFAGALYSTLMRKMRAHQEVPPPPIADFCPEASAGLVAAVDRMLAKNPAERFATPAEVAAALAPFAAGADLGRLLNGDAAAPSDLSAHIVTPAPGAWETDSERRGRQSPSREPTRLRTFPVVLMALSVAGLLWIGWLYRPSPNGPPTPLTPHAPVATPLAITALNVSHYRDNGKKELGDLRSSTAGIVVNDDVHVRATLTAPAYCYLIAFNPDGEDQLCLPTDVDGRGARNTAPKEHEKLHYPPDKKAFILDATGLQAFVLVASTKPLPPYAEWRAKAGKIPWNFVNSSADSRWHFDGHEFTRFPQERGKLVTTDEVPDRLRRLCEFFKSRPEFEAVQAIAFPVVALPAPAGQRKSATPPKQLSKDDTEWVQKKYAEALVFGRQGKWGHDEAQAPVREIVDRCSQVLGQDHYMTADYRREIDTLKKLAQLREADRLEYMKTYTFFDEANELYKKSRYADAVRPMQQMLDIYRRILGPDHPYTALGANGCGHVLSAAGKYADAATSYREALRIRRRALGENHPDTAVAYNNLATALDKQALYNESEPLFRKALDVLRAAEGDDGVRVATATDNLALNLHRQGRDTDAEPLYKEALRIRRTVLGEDHPDTAISYNNLAGHFEQQARFTDAEALYRKEVKIFRAAKGERGDKLATALNNLAHNLQQQGKHAEAEELYQEALTIYRDTVGENSADTGRVYMNLATNREGQGHIAAAEPLLRKALASYKNQFGDNSPETAWALNNLGVNLDKQHKTEEAERRLREAVAIVSRVPGEQARAVAKMSSNLASCLRLQKKLPDAQALCEKALATLLDKLGPDHPDVAAAHNNVAATLNDLERYADAEGHLRKSLKIMEQQLGAEHPETAHTRVNLAVNLYHQGRYADAEPLLLTALAGMKRVLGEANTKTAWAFKNLIGNSVARGDYAQADGLNSAATASFEAARLRLGFAGLDRVRASEDMSPLPGLAVAAARLSKPAAAWQALERNLARGLLDDVAARQMTDQDRQRLQALLEKLDALDRRIAGLRTMGTDAEADRRKAEVDRDTAQAELVRALAAPVAKQGVPAGRVYDLAEIQQQLPEDAALLAWIDLPNCPKWADPKGDHWACLVRRRGEPVWVQLPGTGANRSWTNADEKLASGARSAFAARPNDPTGEWKDVAGKLAEQRLAPLEGHLKAAGERPAVRQLIVLPSPKMAGLPVEALPGVAGRFVVSYAPSGTMFAWLREPRAARAAPAAKFLGLGDPAFQSRKDGPKADALPPNGRREPFSRLSGTRQELMGVARLFSESRLLMGDKANSRELELLAQSGGLAAFRYLHFATHGVLDDQRPMQSALLLAQEPPVGPQPPGDVDKGSRDGRLTAEHILRDWKLDADLVTLSACDTGLGALSGGEGYLGFSQALFLAGGRSLVLSLWQVDDAATALLMTRFYENLLGTPERTVEPMPKARALAEAKEWLRGLRPDEVKQLTADLSTRGTRGRIEPRKDADDSKSVRSYDHPYYWSGFILIGDPQ
jgi:serine/threonine protein kinase/CHAT domain-containing protein/tetratricopeptide (TPR) repeat protein